MLRIVGVMVCMLTSTLVQSEPLDAVASQHSKALSSAVNVKASQRQANTLLDDAQRRRTSAPFKAELQKARQEAIQTHSAPGGHFYDVQSLRMNPSLTFQEAAKLTPQSEPTPWTGAPLIFISFSMPTALIQAYLQEAQITQAQVVVRGAIDNDLKKTISTMQALVADFNVGNVFIDPTLFERFNITAVPAFVLVMDELEPCDTTCKAPPHAKAYGSTTLVYFLETLTRLGTPDEIDRATQLLGRYQEGT